MLYLVIFLLLLAVQLLYFRIASRMKIVDRPNHRSSHTKPTLLGGGIVFYAAALIYFVVSGFQFPWFFTGLTIIAAISYYDDLRPLSQKLRIIFHTVALLLMFIELGFFANNTSWLIIILLLVLFEGFINAYNFMDGINGMLAGYNVVLTSILIYINHFIVEFVDERILVFILMALIIFSFFNFRKKAVCFAGDVGAFTLGFLFVYLIAVLIVETGNFAYIGLLTIYGVDTILTILHRIYLRENIVLPHRRHLFQILVNECSLSHTTVTILYISLQLIISVGLLFFINISELKGYIYAVSSIALVSATYIGVKIYCQKYFALKEVKVK